MPERKFTYKSKKDEMAKNKNLVRLVVWNEENYLFFAGFRR